jgi:hypothetical protein
VERIGLLPLTERVNLPKTRAFAGGSEENPVFLREKKWG